MSGSESKNSWLGTISRDAVSHCIGTILYTAIAIWIGIEAFEKRPTTECLPTPAERIAVLSSEETADLRNTNPDPSE